MRRLLTIGGACLAVAVFGGCGDDEEEPAAAGAAEAPAETAAGGEDAGGSGDAASGAEDADEAGGETIVVTMRDFEFTPRRIEASVGDTIEWHNEDTEPHNATAPDGDLETETFEQGGSDTYTVDEPGTIEYICSIHPEMTGTIVVRE